MYMILNVHIQMYSYVHTYISIFEQIELPAKPLDYFL